MIRAALAFLIALGMAAGAAAQTPRPKIGLVLSGGGARGIAHVGVLKVLEREGVPIDVITGTSMGAIIGGLYASGMRAEEIERELLKVNWNTVFASRIERQALSQRRKEEDFEIATALEIGMRDGELRAPLGALSGRGLETLLRRYTLPVGEVANFDVLPIPFRAVATDLENGQAVVLDRGDLALALRSSMSVPGVFAPTEVAGRILGDGGLVNNLPVDVARAMGAQIVIAVNIGTPLAGRDALSSVGGLTAQMINILTEQNVQRTLATLAEADVLIAPNLGGLSSGDFARTAELIESGEQGALPLVPRLARLALSREAYAAWRAGLRDFERRAARVDFIAFEGTRYTNPARFVAQLESKPGQPFDPAKAERDARRIAASGDYERADYRLVATAAGDGLVFEVDDKPWGPHYFRVGLDLNTDFTGDSAFNVKISHNRHWLDANGSEWRNQLQIGEQPRWLSEWYHPLNWTIGISNDWFVSTIGEVSRRKVVDYDNDTGDVLGRYNLRTLRLGVDLGQPWGELGELRLGLLSTVRRSRPEIISAAFVGSALPVTLYETGLRARMVVDQLDYANFPQRGYRVTAEWFTGERRSDGAGEPERRISRFEATANVVRSWQRDTLNAYALIQGSDQLSPDSLGRYTLGGFHQLSGYRPGQLDGNAVVFARLIYYRRSEEIPLFTRGLFYGASLEAGNVWERASQANLGGLRGGGSLFAGADTGIGPVYLGLTYARRGEPGLVLVVGRP